MLFFSSTRACAIAAVAKTAGIIATKTARKYRRVMRVLLLHDIAHKTPWSDFGAIDDPVFVRGDSFCRAGRDGLLHRIGNEIFDGTVFRRTDPHSALPA